MIEDEITRGLFSKNTEKTFIDKILAKDDIAKMKDLVRKEDLTRSDMLELLYLISGVEQKLVNYSEWDRYVILKFFVWIREFVKLMELLFDWEDNQKKIEEQFTLTAEQRLLFDKSKKIMEHNVKFLMDLFLNIMRSSLSVNGSAFFEILRNKYELKYDYSGQLVGAQQEKKSLFSLKSGGK